MFICVVGAYSAVSGGRKAVRSRYSHGFDVRHALGATSLIMLASTPQATTHTHVKCPIVGNYLYRPRTRYVVFSLE